MKRQGVWLVLLVILLAGLAGLTSVNYRFASENPGGNHFLVYWVGTRALVLEGMNPYTEEVAEQTQEMVYGRAARTGEDELRVAYPLYAMIVFLPFSLINDFTMARAAWMTLLEAALILLMVVSVRLARWRVSPLGMIVLALFSLAWYHGVRPLINGNVVILVALWLAAGFLALRAGADELAGLLFALTTIKPNVVVLVLVFVAVWGFSTGRTRAIWWMLATVFLLSATAALFIPDWIVHNLRVVLGFASYSPPGSPREAFMELWPAWGSRVGWAVTGVVGLMLLVEWWSNRYADARGFLWTACLTLTAGQWSGIHTDPGNFVILVPAVVLVFSLLDERWRAGGRFFVLLSLIALGVGIWAVFLNTVIAGDQPVQSAVLFFPLPAFLLLTLYWVRWWAVQPPTVWFDMMDR